MLLSPITSESFTNMMTLQKGSQLYNNSTYRAVLIYLIVSLFLFFEMALQVSPSVMAKQLMDDFHINTFALGLMSGCYFYSYTLMQIPSGLLFDRFNPRSIILGAISFCILGSLIFAFATNLYEGAIARILTGLGSAFAFIGVLVVTADLFAARYFAIITGITQIFAALGAMLGQMPISLLVTSIGWRKTMLLMSGIGIGLAILVWVCLRYQRTNTANTQNAASHHAVFNQIQIILSNKQTWLIALYACLLWAPMSGFASLWGVPFLMKTYQLTDHTASLFCTLMWLGLAIGSPLLGWFANYRDNYLQALAISASMGAIAFALILFAPLSIYSLGACLFIAGAACAGQTLSFTVVKDNNKKPTLATAIAFNNMAVVISGAIFQPLIGKMIALETHNQTLYSTITNFKAGLSIVLVCYLIAFLMASLFIRKQKPEKNNLATK